jgi:hypothetical protein
MREAVGSLLRTRSEIAARIAARHVDLQSAVRVCTSFLLLSAIDNALRTFVDQHNKAIMVYSLQTTYHAMHIGSDE